MSAEGAIHRLSTYLRVKRSPRLAIEWRGFGAKH